jgi:hypothetical protein
MSGRRAGLEEVAPPRAPSSAAADDHQHRANACNAEYLRSRRRVTKSAVIGLTVAAIPYLWVLWGGRFDPFRTDLEGGTTRYARFFDWQARALFHGNWALPKGALGVEAFVIHGRQYMYFGPLPSLLRMPVLALTSSLDGKLTAPSLLLAWLVTGLFTSLLVWRVRLNLRGPVTVSRAESVSIGVLIATIMSGSVLLYLASLPWVFNEDYAWGVATGIAALFALLGVLERPSTRRVVATGALTLAATLSRSTVGWGVVIAVALTAMWFGSGRGGVTEHRWWRPVLLAGVIPLVVGCIINWIKLGVLFGIPMSTQIYTTMNAHRRQVLALNGGRLWSPTFLPSTMWAYFRPTGLRLTPVFPFITLPAVPSGSVTSAVLDQTYRTASLPTSMPLLFLLAGFGLIVAFRRGKLRQAGPVRIVLFGAGASTAGVFLWGYIANRYLADLMPVVILASIVGLIELWRRLDAKGPRLRRRILVAIAALGVFGIAANLAITSTPQDPFAWGGKRIHDYVATQKAISDLTGHPLGRYITRATQLPNLAPADQLYVIGNCDALFLSTGEAAVTWAPVEIRELGVDITFHGVRPARPVPIVTVGNGPTTTVTIEENQAGLIRFAADTPRHEESLWLKVVPNRRYRLRVINDYASSPTAALPAWPGLFGEIGKVPNLRGVDLWLNDAQVLNWRTSVRQPQTIHPFPATPNGPPPPYTIGTLRSPPRTLCQSLIGQRASGRPPLRGQAASSSKRN